MIDIQHRIVGDDLQFVEFTLQPGQSVVSEPGAMMYMDEQMTMNTVLGDGSAEQGFITRIVRSFKRVFTGESLFTTVFTNETPSPKRVAFASPYPGKIIPVQLAEVGGELICQKGAFLCAARGVEVGVAFQKRLRVGFFGGEGFIMQKLRGSGIAFVHATGTLEEMELKPGESLRVDTGCLAALQPSVRYDIRYAGKLKTALFGGEGLFFAHLQGPGKVWMQSLPVRRLATELLSKAVVGGRGSGMGARMYLIFVVIVILITIFAGPEG